MDCYTVGHCSVSIVSVHLLSLEYKNRAIGLSACHNVTSTTTSAGGEFDFAASSACPATKQVKVKRPQHQPW